MAAGQQGADTGGAARPGRRAWWRRLWPGAEDGAAGRAARRRAAHALYLAVVEQARRPVFYRDWGVPDTPEGRFGLVGLHAFLVLRRLRACGEPGRALGQELFDLVFADLDGGLRELGVGDLSVGKHVKRHARAFYGLTAALERALAGAAAPAAVEAVLRRNLYPAAGPPGAAGPAAFAGYVLAQDRHLAARPGEPLLDGRVGFAPPPAPGGSGDRAGERRDTR